MIDNLLKHLRVFSLFLVLLFLTVSISYGSTNSTAFTSGGIKYIYSNNPEPLIPDTVSGNAYGRYSIEQKIEKNTEYDCEFTHGNKSYTDLNIGIAIKNTGRKPQIVRIFSEQLGYAKFDLDMFSKLALQYQLGLTDKLERVVRVPAKSTVVLRV